MQEASETSNTLSDQFIKQLNEASSSAEERLTACLDFMKQCLAQEGKPDFKGFWQVRQYCFPLFKESLSRHSRALLWEQYTDLTREGRRLKNLLDAESSFAAEQIGLAIQDMQTQIEALIAQDFSTLSSDFEMPKVPQSMKRAKEKYADTQHRLCLINLFASRIQGLRKELIKTQMRMKQKNGLFAQLSEIGDRIFPLRKQLMQELNTAFIDDVDAFAEHHFSEKNFCPEKVRKQVFFFRDEIKLFQNLAKVLTLDTHAFSHTRQRLSQCWDCLKGMEKELKKEYAEQKVESTQHAEAFGNQITAIANEFASQSMTAEEGLERLRHVQQSMRKAILIKADVQKLKDQIGDVSKTMEEVLQKKREQKQQQEAAIDAKRKEGVVAFEHAIQTFIQTVNEGNMKEQWQTFADLRLQLKGLSCHHHEKVVLEGQLKVAKDMLMERQQAMLLELPAESRQVIEELTTLLKERKERRSEIKKQLDDYRKQLAGSSLDIEKSMQLQELLAQEKEALEHCDTSILEIEKKIRDVQS